MTKFIRTSNHKNQFDPGKLSSPIRPTKARIVPKITKYIAKIRRGLLLFFVFGLGLEAWWAWFFAFLRVFDCVIFVSFSKKRMGLTGVFYIEKKLFAFF